MHESLITFGFDRNELCSLLIHILKSLSPCATICTWDFRELKLNEVRRIGPWSDGIGDLIRWKEETRGLSLSFSLSSFLSPSLSSCTYIPAREQKKRPYKLSERRLSRVESSPEKQTSLDHNLGLPVSRTMEKEEFLLKPSSLWYCYGIPGWLIQVSLQAIQFFFQAECSHTYNSWIPFIYV